MMATIFLTVTVMIAITGMTLSQQESRISSNAMNTTTVFHIAESGIQHAINQLSQPESVLFQTIIDNGMAAINDPMLDGLFINNIEIISQSIDVSGHQPQPLRHY